MYVTIQLEAAINQIRNHQKAIRRLCYEMVRAGVIKPGQMETQCFLSINTAIDEIVKELVLQYFDPLPLFEKRKDPSEEEGSWGDPPTSGG